MNASRRIVVTMAVMAFVLVGCATPPRSLPATTFILNASPDLNPGGDGRPSPVVVRIYQLAARDDFDRAGFFDLYDHDKVVLGSAAVARTDIAIRPGEQLRFSRELDPKTHEVAVVAAYRDIDAAHWRAVADVSAPGTHALSVELGASAVAISDAYEKPPGYWGKLKKFVKPVWTALGSALSVFPAAAMPNTEMPKMEVPKMER
ncbi:type VI secretion system lipoprotein TssJ [Burkholderia ubonensis]|uniref:type VI secretion system lipoprotein TssJ n=1 Tax=Burkholderia ubonensis TaxID=101571 RepID=UPI0009B4C938|nr:type VI secretion system lipoprotein TssJ [Burkholderia ubonensis]